MNTWKLIATTGVVLTLGGPSQAFAVEDVIGDIDGFGISPTTGLVRATGAPHTTPADTDGDGIIEPGEYLPDRDQSGLVCITCGDDFDHRSVEEAGATTGAQWTDRSINSYPGSADGATFTFTFAVPVFGDDDYGVDHFVNFVFGDFDVTPATIVIDGVTVPLTGQTVGNDGLVQAAHAPVPWASMTDGEVVIRLNAPNEPYLAFDYALLSTDQLADADDDGVPDSQDNCILTANIDQRDADADGAGDACDDCPLDADDDSDGDGVCGDLDNCASLPNPDQRDSDGDGIGNDCDSCPFTAGQDNDGDGVCRDVDNCPSDANAAQIDSDGDGRGDACDSCDTDPENDADGDGICGDVDRCAGTTWPESVPSESLGINRWALTDGDLVFDTTAPGGRGPRRSYSLADTHGCSCAQIIAALGLGEGHARFGCSIGAMDEWVQMGNAQ